ncbi:MAG: GNAT family N-acetyltransferase, partial [Gaiellales bacterium]
CWLDQWWQHNRNGAELTCHVARREGRLVGALPLHVRPVLGVRAAQFLGGRHSALADALLAPGEDVAVAHRLVERASAGTFDYADLYGLPMNSLLATAVPGSHLRLIERIEAPVLDISSGWEATYAAKTTSKKRNLHRRRRRQLAELGRIDVEVATTAPELAPALEDAFRLHALRWEGRPDTSDFTTPAGMRFHRAVIGELARLDVARIVTLKLDGRAIAFHYYFALEGRMYVHCLAFDPALSRYSPGLVNVLDAIEAASAEGLHTVEFLGGDERYKVELADRFEPLYEGIGLAQGPRGRAAVAASLGAIRMRRRLKRSERFRRFYFEGLAPVWRASSRLRGRETPE